MTVPHQSVIKFCQIVIKCLIGANLGPDRGNNTEPHQKMLGATYLNPSIASHDIRKYSSSLQANRTTPQFLSPIWSDPPLPVPLNKWKTRDLSSYDRNPHTNILNTSFSAINNLNGCTYNIQHAEERLWADVPPPSPSPTAILLVRGVNVYFNSTAAAVPPNCRSSKYKLGRCPTYLSCPGLATLPCSTAAITKILVKYSNESLWIRSVGPSV